MVTGNTKANSMGISAYEREERKGIRYAQPCMICDGSGEMDCGRGWQVVTCETCDGVGEYWRCKECDERKAVCDDDCVECHVAFMLENPEEFEPESPHWLLPGFKDALEQINAALAAKGSK